jgi:hypothetical protein
MHRLACDPADFVTNDRMEIPRRAFHLHMQDREALAVLAGGPSSSPSGVIAQARSLVTTVEERSPRLS